MGLFDKILTMAQGNPTVHNMAEKVGIEPEKAAEAIAALSEAHQEKGDTVELASQKTGLSTGIIEQVREHMGGEGSLTEFARMLDRDGDGNPVNDITGFAAGLFGKK